jgi:hypothetical protein
MQEDMREKNRNYTCVFIGMPRMGKSWSAMKFCEFIDPNFTAENIAFNEDQFLQLLNKEMPSGSCIMFDEGGVALDNRDAMSMVNKLMGYIVQTMGHRNQCVVLTVPNSDWIDCKIESLINITFEMKKRPNAKSGFTTATMRRHQPNYSVGKVYKHPKAVVLKGVPFHVGEVFFSRPSAELVKAYEVRKKEFTKDLFTTSAKKITEQKNKPVKVKQPSNAELVEYAIKNNKTPNQLALEFNFGCNKLTTIKGLLAEFNSSPSHAVGRA